MHILFLTDNFPPEVNAPASRTFEHCKEWVKAGHRVTVVTCAPNFPHGRVYDGYVNRMLQNEIMEGVRVIRVWSYITANEGFIKRILDYLSYMVTATVASPFVRNPDIVIGTSPQFFTACAAYLVSRMKKIPFIFELRDLWPESIKAVGAMQHSAVIGLLERIELFLYRKAANVVSVTNSFKKILVIRGIIENKIAVITGGVDTFRFYPRPKDQELIEHYGLKGKFVAGFIGTHGMAHALETILEAAKQMQEEGNDVLRFILLGHGAKKQDLLAKAGGMGLSNLIFIDSVSKEQVTRYWSLLDVSIIHLKKADLFQTVIPSKLFECMGMGIPVLHGVAGESAEIIKRERVGLIFEPENAADLCDNLMRLYRDRTLYENFRKNCIAAADKYDRSNLATQMLSILQGVTGI